MNSNVPRTMVAGAIGLALLTTCLVLAQQAIAQGNLNPVSRPKISPQVNPTKVTSPYAYTKKRLAISAVDYLSSANNPSYTNTGEAVLALTADDVVDLPPDVNPDLVVFATQFPDHPFKKMPRTTDMGLTNTDLYEYQRGTTQTVEGSRVYARYDRQMQAIRLKLMQTYYQIDARSTSGNNGVSSDIFCIHVNMVDDARKIWYYGKVAVRLFMAGREEYKKG